MTTLFELGIGWLILTRFPERILLSNTIALTLGAALHYYLTAKYAFRAKHSLIGAGMYAATFAAGLVIQNAVIWAMYHKLLASLPEGAQYLLSKTVSMAVALVLVYIARDAINRHIKTRDAKRKREDETDKPQKQTPDVQDK